MGKLPDMSGEGRSQLQRQITRNSQGSLPASGRDMRRRKRRRKGTKQGGLNTARVELYPYHYQHEEEKEMNTREQESDRRQEMEKENNKEVPGQGNYFDGLDMDFWEEDGEEDPKHDYRTRWNDLKNEYDATEARDDKTSDKNYTKGDIGSRRFYEE